MGRPRPRCRRRRGLGKSWEPPPSLRFAAPPAGGQSYPEGPAAALRKAQPGSPGSQEVWTALRSTWESLSSRW